MTASTKLVLTRKIAASPARVFKACSDPALLMKWLGPKAFSMTEVDADFRVGGRFAFRMVGADGTFAAEGRYQEIVNEKRIVLTWKWTQGSTEQPPDGVTSLVTIEVEAVGAGTRVTLTHEQLPDQTQVDEHEQGWTESLDKLERLFEGAEE